MITGVGWCGSVNDFLEISVKKKKTEKERKAPGYSADRTCEHRKEKTSTVHLTANNFINIKPISYKIYEEKIYI